MCLKISILECSCALKSSQTNCCDIEMEMTCPRYVDFAYSTCVSWVPLSSSLSYPPFPLPFDKAPFEIETTCYTCQDHELRP